MTATGTSDLKHWWQVMNAWSEVNNNNNKTRGPP